MKPIRVVIMEDDAALLRGLRDNFLAQGYQVDTATDGRRGLESILADPPDLLILDLMLPSLSGYEVCAAIRSRGLQFPVLMLTARGQEEDIVRGLDTGADDYLTKPFGIRELLARVKALLRRQPQETDVVAFADFRLDRAAHKLFRQGREVTLTAKEYRLLDFFLRRAGRALTRNAILDAVWGDEVIVTDRSVDRCVTTLRQKIEDQPRHPCLIQTIRDVGYRFDLPSPETGGREADR